ncbi:MAG TPA: hypothetical protein VKV23_00115 [Acidimicrobiales bacterium]|nr:hypothetical protein [Acidimicrobiales bacterium]
MTAPEAVRDLVATAEDRWRSVRAAGRFWQDRQATRRALARRRTRLGVQPRGLPAREVSSTPLGERATAWRLWRGGAVLVRAEYELGAETVTVVGQGPRWWRWSPRLGATSGGGAGAPVGLVLGPPSVLVDGRRLLDALELASVEEAVVAGRPAYAVRAVPRAGGGRARLALREAGMGADEYLVAVDAERGVILAVTALLDGEAFQACTTDAVTFDEELAAELFAPAAAPDQHFVAGGNLVRRLSPADLAERVGFAVLVPVPSPSPSPPHVALFDADARTGTPTHAVLTYAIADPAVGRGQLRILLAGSEPPRSARDRWREVAPGIEGCEERSGRLARAKVRARLASTFVELSSSVLGIDRLVEVARSLAVVRPGGRASG